MDPYVEGHESVFCCPAALPREGIGGSYAAFRYDFYYGGELVLPDFVNQQGMTLNLPVPAGGIICDYGLSMGAYRTDQGEIRRLDGRLFFLLDHPEPVADYRPTGVGPPWDKHFWRDELEWVRKYGDTLWEGETPRQYQSLRHFGRANVLFCDGHIETLGLSDEADAGRLAAGKFLDPGSPLWEYGTE